MQNLFVYTHKLQSQLSILLFLGHNVSKIDHHLSDTPNNYIISLIKLFSDILTPTT